MDRVSIERMCTGRQFQVEGADPRGKVASNTGWSGKEIVLEERKDLGGR